MHRSCTTQLIQHQLNAIDGLPYFCSDTTITFTNLDQVLFYWLEVNVDYTDIYTEYTDIYLCYPEIVKSNIYYYGNDNKSKHNINLHFLFKRTKQQLSII